MTTKTLTFTKGNLEFVYLDPDAHSPEETRSGNIVVLNQVTGETFGLPMAAVKAFVAHLIRQERKAQLDMYPDDQILGLRPKGRSNMINLVQLGNFTLNSGANSQFKLECDQFIEDNLPGLVFLIRQIVGPFGSVEGVPRGGLKLAEALRPFVSKEGTHLVVDDVLTTGGSMDRLRAERVYPCCEAVQRVEARPGDQASLTGGECPIHGCTHVRNCIFGIVVFARGKCPPWIKCVFQLPEELWIKKE